MRAAHLLQSRLNVPPGFRFFLLAAFFEGAGLSRSLDNRLSAVGFQQLPRVVVDFSFLHLHGDMLLLNAGTRLGCSSIGTGLTNPHGLGVEH